MSQYSGAEVKRFLHVHGQPGLHCETDAHLGYRVRHSVSKNNKQKDTDGNTEELNCRLRRTGQDPPTCEGDKRCL